MYRRLNRPGCDVRRICGAANAWRMRAGYYRGIHAIEESKIVFTRFGHRKDIYRPRGGCGGSRFFHWRPHEGPPLRPEPIVVPDLRVAEEGLQDQPPMRRSLAGSAIRDIPWGAENGLFL